MRQGMRYATGGQQMKYVPAGKNIINLAICAFIIASHFFVLVHIFSFSSSINFFLSHSGHNFEKPAIFSWLYYHSFIQLSPLVKDMVRKLHFCLRENGDMELILWWKRHSLSTFSLCILFWNFVGAQQITRLDCGISAELRL